MFLKKSLQLFRYQNFGSIHKFYLPDLGEKIKEATVKKWHIKVGDNVDEFQEIADVATDKLHTTIPSEFKGKIHKIFHQEEDECQVGELFFEIELNDNIQEVTKKQSQQQTQQQTQQEQVKQEQTQQQQVQQQQVQQVQQQQVQQEQVQQKQSYEKNETFATPAIRNLLKQYNLDIQQVIGSGPNGRVMKADILQHINQKDKKVQQEETVDKTVQKEQVQQKETVDKTVQKEQVQQKETVVQKISVQNSKVQQNQDENVVKMTDYEKGMQKSMTQAQTIPHFYLMEEIDITELSEMRENFKKNLNLSMTYMPFFIKTFSLAMKDYPIINSLYDDSKPFEYKQMNEHNISIAIDSPKGLVVPNIKQTQNLSMIQIQQEMNRLRDNAQIGKLEGKDLFGGTVGISNIGNIGGTYTGPLIMSPQVAIVAIGKIQTVPKYMEIKQQDGTKKLELVPRKMVYVSFGGDHRVLNGATAARFIKKWKDQLENPQSILLNLK